MEVHYVVWCEGNHINALLLTEDSASVSQKSHLPCELILII